MATPRTYGDRCAAARALDLVGQRWALLVVRELLLGAKRFTDLAEGMPNAKPSVLSQRLRELEQGGVVQRRTLGPPARVSVYELTDMGRELEPVVIALGRWGRRLPMPTGAAHGIDSLVLALKWRFNPEAAGDLSATYGLRMAGDGFRIGVADGRMEVQRGEPDEPDSVIETDPRTLERVIFDGGDAAEAERSGELRLAGDRALATRLLKLYAPARS
ncbi:MAG TPA: winged helix-turn-helix transcriptional regulator [Thermoleophilaceae bacterium]|jgi:DNA-binding HxlR family transcriptional regulator